tara:strand:+ start:2236 stop:3162 length:927 start_codon:yes stop_codon:yes gene_type:complete
LISKKIILVIISAVIIYSFFLFVFDSQIIYEKLENFETKFVPIILIMVILGWGILFVRWNFLLKKQAINIPTKENFLIYLSGFVLAISPLKSGEILKSELLKNKFDISRTKTVPIIVMERFYDIIGTVFVAVVVGFFFLGVSFLPIIFVVSVLSIAAFIVIYTKSVFNFIVSKIFRFKFLKKFKEPLENSQEIFRNSSTPKLIFVSTGLTILWRFVEGIGIYFVLLGFGIDIIEYLEIISIYSTSIILGAASMLPAGIGITEGSFGSLLSLTGIEISFAVVLGIVIRLFTLWFGVVIGFIALKLSKSL